MCEGVCVCVRVCVCEGVCVCVECVSGNFVSQKYLKNFVCQHHNMHHNSLHR